MLREGEHGSAPPDRYVRDVDNSRVHDAGFSVTLFFHFKAKANVFRTRMTKKKSIKFCYM